MTTPNHSIEVTNRGVPVDLENHSAETSVCDWIHQDSESYTFPLDWYSRVTRSVGDNPRHMRAEQHTRAHGCAIERDQIKNHFAS